MKKIIILNRSINRGGIDEVGVEVAKFLSQDFEVFLVTYFLFKKTDIQRIKIIDLGVLPSGNIFSKVVSNVRRFLRYRSETKKINPDLVIAQGNGPDFIVGLDKIFGANYKTILTIHNIFSKDLSGMKGNFEKILFKLIKSKTDKWVSVSDSVTADFEENFRVKDVETIPNPTKELPKVKTVEGRFIFSAGRLEKQKDFQTLIKAFGKVAEQISGIKLIIAGSGSQKRHLEELIVESKLDSRVSLIGQIDNIYGFLSGCEFFVSSSLYEGMPMGVLQALKLGKPVIATDVDGTRQAVGDSGVFSRVGDIDKLAENMLNLLNNKSELNRLSGLAIKQAEKFSPDKVGKKWLGLIEGLLE